MGISATVATVPISPLPAFSAALAGTTHTGQKKGWDLLSITKPAFPLPSCFDKLLHILQNSAVIISKRLFLIPSSRQRFVCPVNHSMWVNACAQVWFPSEGGIKFASS